MLASKREKNLYFHYIFPTLFFTTYCCGLIMAQHYVIFYSYQVPATMLFGLGYSFLADRIAIGQKVNYLRRLTWLNLIFGGLFVYVLRFIPYLPMAESSLSHVALWEKPISSWVLGYMLWVGVRSLLLTIPSIALRIKRAPVRYLTLFDLSAIGILCGILGLLCSPTDVVKMVKETCLLYSIGLIIFRFFYHLFRLVLSVFLKRTTAVSCADENNLATDLIHAIFNTTDDGLLGKDEKIDDDDGLPLWGYHFFLLCFVGVCIMTNLLVVKHFTCYGFLFTVGVLSYPLTFVCIDVITERYGKGYAKKTIWMGLWANLGLLAAIVVVAQLPIGENSEHDMKVFWETFGFVSTSLIASMIAYLVSQFISLSIFSTLRQKTARRYLWLRNNIATIISQGIDTILFALLAWFLWQVIPASKETAFSFGQWLSIARNEYVAKIVLALLDTPIVYIIIALFPTKELRQVRPSRKRPNLPEDNIS